MSRWAVDPAQVRAGAGGVQAVGNDVSRVAAEVAQALTSVAGAGGDPAVAQSATSASRRWGHGLDGLGAGTCGLAAAATAAAIAYRLADAGVAEAFTKGRA
jgi:hypothetical protein